MTTPKTPLLIGAKTVTQRFENPNEALNALELLVSATKMCVSDLNVAPEKVFSRLQSVICMSSMTKMGNPAQLLLEKILPEVAEGKGSSSKPPKTIMAEVGVLQQTPFNMACNEILENGADAVLVVGTEAEYKKLRHKIAGEEIPEPPFSEIPPDETLAPELDILHPLEHEIQLYTAPSHYSLIENAFGIAKGKSPKEQRAATAKLWEGFSEVASENPFAAFKEPMGAKEIAQPSERNRPIAAPYNKWNCSQINVDQATALLFVSKEFAMELGVAEEEWIFPVAGAVSNNMVPIVERKEIHRCQGFEIVGKAVLESSGLSIDGINKDVDYFELYSCFPVAVWIQAEEMGIDISSATENAHQPTLTGGMTFSGGPLNSFVLGGLARMTEVLKSEKANGNKKTGLVTSISGMITKQGAGIFSTHDMFDGNPEKQIGANAFSDFTKEVRASTPTLEVDADYFGGAVARTSNLLYDREGNPERAICVADTPSGKRTMALSTKASILNMLNGDEYIGRLPSGTNIEISKAREFTLN